MRSLTSLVLLCSAIALPMRSLQETTTVAVSRVPEKSGKSRSRTRVRDTKIESGCVPRFFGECTAAGEKTKLTKDQAELGQELVEVLNELGGATFVPPLQIHDDDVDYALTQEGSDNKSSSVLLNKGDKLERINLECQGIPCPPAGSIINDIRKEGASRRQGTPMKMIEEKDAKKLFRRGKEDPLATSEHPPMVDEKNQVVVFTLKHNNELFRIPMKCQGECPATAHVIPESEGDVPTLRVGCAVVLEKIGKDGQVISSKEMSCTHVHQTLQEHGIIEQEGQSEDDDDTEDSEDHQQEQGSSSSSQQGRMGDKDRVARTTEVRRRREVRPEDPNVEQRTVQRTTRFTDAGRGRGGSPPLSEAATRQRQPIRRPIEN